MACHRPDGARATSSSPQHQPPIGVIFGLGPDIADKDEATGTTRAEGKRLTIHDAIWKQPRLAGSSFKNAVAAEPPGQAIVRGSEQWKKIRRGR
jgi:hypothetical protein